MTLVKLTRYYLVSADDYPAANNIIPVKDKEGNTIAMVDPNYFAAMSLEGSGKLSGTGGKILNVDGGYTTASSQVSAALKDIADRMYRSHYGYVGLSNDCSKYFTYSVSPSVWGVGIHNFSLMPFVSVASDQHYYPFGTTLFAPKLQGLQMPDGTTHMGYLYCCDTGSAIVGAHLDWFCGYKKWELNDIVPGEIEVEVYKTPQQNNS